ncbi:cAMP-specific 3',5'-cyclic phosphodiesterase 4D [Dinochytrium kinnereticum]|nr:cAMP-specific 3',5'-cyclic phosphodiesterase 4D [Dinochytrium kinnereticum]
MHLKIARHLRKTVRDVTGIHDIDGELDFVNHYNKALAIVEDVPEIVFIARTNYAKGISACSDRPSEASEYLTYATKLISRISNNVWADFYEIMYGANLALLKITVDLSPHLVLEAEVENLLKNVKSSVERANITHALCSAYVKQSNWNKAIDVGLDYLHAEGFIIPRNKEDLKKFDQTELKLLEAQLDRKTPKEVVKATSLKAMKGDEQGKQMILSVILIASLRVKYFTELCKLLSGHCEDESVYRSILYRITCCEPFISSVEETSALIESVMSYSRASGKHNLRYFASIMLLDLGVQWGLPLSWYHELVSKHLDFALQITMPSTYAFRHMVAAMESASTGEDLHDVDGLSPALCIALKCLELRNAFIFEKVNQMQLFESMLLSLDMLKMSAKIIDFLLFGILILTSAFDKAEELEKLELRKRVDELFAYLKDFTSAEPQPNDFKRLLAEAEVHRIHGDIMPAVTCYESAILISHTKGFRLYEAVSSELFGKFWLSRSSYKMAQICILEALNLWVAWGSEAKYKLIYSRYPELLQSMKSNLNTRWASSGVINRGKWLTSANASILSKESLSDPSTTADLDAVTILKISHSIRNETSLDELLRQIMKYILNNVGATKGVLALDDNGQLMIQAISRINGNGEETIEVLQNIPLSSSSMADGVPLSLAQYVFRTKETVLMSNPKANATYGLDPYVLHESPQTILCCPIIHHSAVTGLIYLENKFQEGVFTQDRFMLIQSLMPTVSMSIENAKLIKANAELEAALKAGAKIPTSSPKYNIDAPIRRAIDILQSMKGRLPSSDDNATKQIDSLLTILTTTDLFASSIDEINDENGKGIDLDTKSWIENSLLQKSSKAPPNRENSKDQMFATIELGRNSSSGKFAPSDTSSSSSALLNDSSLSTLDRTSTLDKDQCLRLGTDLHLLQVSAQVNLSDINDTLENIMSSDFDVFHLEKISSGRPLYYTSLHLLEKNGLVCHFNIDDHVCRAFLRSVEESSHAADVLQTVNMLLLSDILMAQNFTKLEIFAAFIASAVHDIDHPGVNNNFLVQSSHPLAILYNDMSVLEFHHASRAFDICKKKETDIFATFSSEDRKTVRKLIISMVIATDMAQHFNYINKLKGKLSTSGLNFQDTADRSLVLEMAIKCADLNNPTKSTESSKAWAYRVLEEFFDQGDRERQMGMTVSTFMDRNDTNIPKCQVGFIDILVMPLFLSWAECIPTDYSKKCIENLHINRAYWESILTKPEEVPKIPVSESRVIDFSDSFRDFSVHLAKVDESSKQTKTRFATNSLLKAKDPAISIGGRRGGRPSAPRRHSSIDNALTKFSVANLMRKGTSLRRVSGSSKALFGESPEGSESSIREDDKPTEPVRSPLMDKSASSDGVYVQAGKSESLFKKARAGFAFGKSKDHELPALPAKKL